MGDPFRMEIIYVLLWKSHLYHAERSLIIDNDSGMSNLFIARSSHEVVFSFKS